jgi:Bacterial sugar transferase
MALITGPLIFIAGIISATLSRVLADEFKAWNPALVQYLIRRAVARLSVDQRPRFEEEWTSHINDIPGDVGKFLTAFGFLSAARKMTIRSHAWVREPFSAFQLFVIRLRDLMVSTTFILLCLPLYLMSSIAVKLDSVGPILVRERMVGRRGRPFDLYKFRVTEPHTPYRITLLGSFFLRYSLNHLPSLINILKGEMSLIGPVIRQNPNPT